MANCKFCGQPAGFLKFSHPACVAADKARRDKEAADAAAIKAKRDAAASQLELTLANFSSKSEQFNDLRNAVARLVDGAALGDTARRTAIFNGLKRFAAGATDVALPPLPVAVKMREFVLQSHLREEAGVLFTPILDQIDRITVLAAVAAGNVADLHATVPPGLNITKGEQPVWGFPGTKLYEDRKHNQRVGGGQGVSVRVARGVYYHTGRFKSHTQTTIEHEQVDAGTLFLTNKTLYFNGSQKSFKIPYAKIVGFDPCPGGVVVRKDGVSAKPAFFVTGDAWFTTNLLSMTMQL